MFPPFLPSYPTHNPHPGVTTKPASGSKGSVGPELLAGIGFAMICGASADAIVSALSHQWFEAGACLVFDVVILAELHALRRAYKRHQAAERWRQALQRRDELKRLRAEAVRLHHSTKAIDAELKPLVNRMMAGAI